MKNCWEEIYNYVSIKKTKGNIFFLLKNCARTLQFCFCFFFFLRTQTKGFKNKWKKNTHTHTNEKYIKRKRLKKKTKEKEKTKTDGFRKKIMATHVHVAHGFLIFFFIGVSPLVFSPFWGKTPVNFFSSPPSNQTSTKNILSPPFYLPYYQTDP